MNEARQLLATARAGLTDDLLFAQAGLLEGQLALGPGDGADAPKLLLRAAERLKNLDAGLARETYLDALTAAMAAGDAAGSVGLSEVAAAARAAPDAPQTPSAPDLLLDGLAALLTEGSEPAARTLHRALSVFPSEDLTSEARLRWSFVACRMAHDVWDDERWDELSARQVQLARDMGALAALPLAVRQRIGVLLHRGEFAAAALLAEELEVGNAVTESNVPAYGALALAGWRGEVDEARHLSVIILQQAASRGDGMGLSHAQYSNAVLFNGLGRYEDALAAAEQACAQPRKLGLGGAALAELVEAASHVGDTASAARALKDITRTTGHSANHWAAGIEARSRALLSDGDEAELLYRAAIGRLARSRAAVALARAHLIYGEWLRRQHRRVDARAELRTAYETFASIGAGAFAQRARRELLATGETVRKRKARHRDDLTPQEAQIARLAAEGLSNPEIGSRLFISPRTVQYHLGKVFTKLEITSRNQLHRVLSADQAD